MQKVLIVEDDEAIANLIKINLEAEGYRCVCAYDGRAGADRIEREEFDLILPGHYLRPIGKKYLLDLMECAEEILAGKAEPEQGDFRHMSSEPALVHRYGQASIVYNEEHIRMK